MGRVYIPALRPYYLAVCMRREIREAVSKGRISNQLYMDTIAQMETYADIGFFHVAKSLVRDLAELSENSKAVTMAKELMFLANHDAERFFNYYTEYVEDAFGIESILQGTE